MTMQEALYHIQQDISTAEKVLNELRDGCDEDAVSDLETALVTIGEAVGNALDAYTRLPRRRRPTLG